MKNTFNFSKAWMWEVIIMVACVIVLFLCINGIFQSIDRAESKLKQHLGEKIVIQGDTLVIVDYSTLSETLTLSNGTIISTDIMNNITLLK